MRPETPGRVLWLTGLSGAGKTTIATEIVRRLRDAGTPAILLDGDAVRAAVGDDRTGHDHAGRLANAWRVARLAQLLGNQGAIVVVATMSLFHVIHAWNRAYQPGYAEVFLRAGLEVLRRRDPKGIYARAARGAETNVCGVDLEPELPLNPHLVIDNDGPAGDIRRHAETILHAAGLAPAPVALRA